MSWQLQHRHYTYDDIPNFWFHLGKESLPSASSKYTIEQKSPDRGCELQRVPSPFHLFGGKYTSVLRFP